MESNDKKYAKKFLLTSIAAGLLLIPAFTIYVFAAKAATKDSFITSKNLDRDFPSIKLRIMETTDLHANLLSYDYFQDAPYSKVGLTKTAALVKKARKEVENSILVDNGDLIQGTPLATYKAKNKPLKAGEVHPVFKAMNLMDYDAATLGNHEFNYGLDFLEEAYNDANFPLVNANVFLADDDQNPNNDENKYKPYKIIKKKVIDNQGKKHALKVGYIGFVPPQTNVWDKANLQGKVIVKDIIETAKKFIPEMQNKGADLIIAMAHSGFSGNNRDSENAVLALSEIPGIDAITFSHTHKLFPAKSVDLLDGMFLGSDGKPLPAIDNEKGTINGVAAVQAGFGGGSLGIIDLELAKEKGKWTVVGSKSFTREIWENQKELDTGNMGIESTIEDDEEVLNAVIGDHNATVKYMNTTIGSTTNDIHSFFALVEDAPSIQVVTNAQKWYVERYIAKMKPELKKYPILAVSSPFKSGRNGADEYTEIKKGKLTIRNISDLYLFDNTFKAIKVQGKVVKEWIEMSAGKFNTIDPFKKEVQPLLNPSYPVYNFDVIDGIQYQIDVTKPAKYDETGNLVNPASSRVINLKYKGKPINPLQEFIVVTNNYRVNGGGNFPGIIGSEIVVDKTEPNFQILLKYVSELKEITPTADQNWSIAPVNETINVTFTSSPRGEKYIKEGSNISYTNQIDEKGFGIYKLILKPN